MLAEWTEAVRAGDHRSILRVLKRYRDRCNPYVFRLYLTLSLEFAIRRAVYPDPTGPQLAQLAEELLPEWSTIVRYDGSVLTMTLFTIFGLNKEPESDVLDKRFTATAVTALGLVLRRDPKLELHDIGVQVHEFIDEHLELIAPALAPRLIKS